MIAISDSSLYTGESILLSVLVVAGVMLGLYRLLKRTRPDLEIGVPTITTAGVHIAAVAGVSTLGSARSLRGGDELLFLRNARALGETSITSTGFVEAFTGTLHEALFALQFKLADFPEGALRINQVGLAAIGMLLIAVAIHDLAGPRAGRIGAWAVGLEPAGLFFSGLLHKEALMVLASGLVVFGASKVWRALDLPGVILMASGCYVALVTRPYAGWFLVAACVAIVLHAAVRHLPLAPRRSAPVLLVTAVAIAAAVPALLQASSEENLKPLQLSQDANVNQAEANLRLEKVDFSSRSAIVTNLPQRVADLLFRPYVWQVANASQQLGVIGSLVALGTLFLLIHTLFTQRGHVLARAGPLLHPLLFLLIAYSLSAGNAGTSFRYRTHLVGLALGAVVAVRLRSDAVPAAEPETSDAGPELALRRSVGAPA